MTRKKQKMIGRRQKIFGKRQKTTSKRQKMSPINFVLQQLITEEF